MKKKKLTGGRRPIDPDERVVQVNFYTKKSQIIKIGGMDEVRDKARTYIESL